MSVHEPSLPEGTSGNAVRDEIFNNNTTMSPICGVQRNNSPNSNSASQSDGQYESTKMDHGYQSTREEVSQSDKVKVFIDPSTPMSKKAVNAGKKPVARPNLDYDIENKENIPPDHYENMLECQNKSSGTSVCHSSDNETNSSIMIEEMAISRKGEVSKRSSKNEPTRMLK